MWKKSGGQVAWRIYVSLGFNDFTESDAALLEIDTLDKQSYAR